MSARSHTSNDLFTGAGHLGFGSFFDTMMVTFTTMYRRNNERAALREMGQHMLDDIGVSQGDALREADKPFWRA